MIWLTGAGGMLGGELAELLDAEGLPWVGSGREVDIADPAALAAFAAGKGIAWILNCAAYTDVDAAEEERELCARANREGPARLGELASSIGASLIHLSTDYVFDGTSGRPYREDAPVAPLGMYGRTKAEGERLLRESCSRSYIVRSSWLYGERGPNFVSAMLRLMRERPSLRVVADRRGSPTWARDLAAAILAIVRSGTADYGIYHYADAGETSWYDFALAIREEARRAGILGRDCEILPISSADYPQKARRPDYSVLSTEKFERSFGLAPPPWRESLGRYLGGLAHSISHG